MTYDAMLDQILSGQMPANGLSHQDHLGTAHAALRRWEFFEAAHRYASALRAVTQAAGAPGKFNATLTLAYLSLVAERMGPEGSEAFVAENPDLRPEALGRIGYDAARLSHPKAREVALLPAGL
ncbi:hypothetical protein [Gymnodinialimonas sp.]